MTWLRLQAGVQVERVSGAGAAGGGHRRRGAGWRGGRPRRCRHGLTVTSQTLAPILRGTRSQLAEPAKNVAAPFATGPVAALVARRAA